MEKPTDLKVTEVPPLQEFFIAAVQYEGGTKIFTSIFADYDSALRYGAPKKKIYRITLDARDFE